MANIFPGPYLVDKSLGAPVLNRQLPIAVASTASSRSQWTLADLNRSARSQWALPDLNRKCQIAVGTTGLQPPAPGRSEHYRTSTASARPQRALTDFNRKRQIAVGTTGPQPQVPDRSGHYRTSTHNTQL